MESQNIAQEMNATTCVENPLQRVDLREIFYQSINEHARLWPGFFQRDLYPHYKLDYFFQFLLGVFVSIRGGSRDSDLEDIYMRPYTFDYDGDSLRIFAIFNDLIVLHDIQDESSELGPETKMMTQQEYSWLKDLIKDKHGLAIDEMDIKYKQYEAGMTEYNDWLLQMSIKHEMDVQVRNATLNGSETKLPDEEEISWMSSRKPALEFFEVDKHSWFFHTYRSNYKQHLSPFYMLEEGIMGADSIFKRLNNHHVSLYEPAAKAYFMHGLLSASLPNRYYNEALQFTSKWKDILPPIPYTLISIPPINPTDPRRIMIDFRDIRNINEDYTIASSIGLDIELHLWKLSVEMAEIPPYRKEVIKFESINLIWNFVEDIKNFRFNDNLEALLEKKKHYLDLLAIKKRFYQQHFNSSRDLHKYFLLGEFRTSLNQKFHINDGSSLHAILIDHDGTKVVLTFHPNGPIAVHQGLRAVVNRPDLNVIGINFGEANASMFTMSLDDATRIYGGFETVLPVKITQLLNEISFTDSSKNKDQAIVFRMTMDDMLRGVAKFLSDSPANNAYLVGIFSKFMIHEWSIEPQSEGILIDIDVETARNLHYHFHVLILGDATKHTSSKVMELAKRKVSPWNAFYLAYNTAENSFVKTIAINGNNRQIIEVLTSKKVLRHCAGELWWKEGISKTSIICPKQNQSRGEDRRTTYQHLEERFRKKHRHLHRQVAKIYKIATRIQIAIVGQRMLFHLLRGDFKAFSIDLAFFGEALSYPYAAKHITRWDEKKAVKLAKKGLIDKGTIRTLIKKIGWSIATVEHCLPTLAFTAFQHHQEIKSDDTVNAAITGTSVVTNLVSCGLESAAAFGLLASSPIIAEMGAILATAFAIPQNIYSGYKQTQQIIEVDPLASSERHYSRKRSVLPWLDADSKLKSMTNQVKANKQAVAMAFRMFPHAKRFLLAAASRVDEKTAVVSYVENNTINMTQKHKVLMSRVMPRQEQIGTDYRLFCAMDEKHVVEKEELEQKMSWSSLGILGPPEIVMAVISDIAMKRRPEVDDYHCINAFGVKTVNSSSSDTTIFLLYNGTDKVVGFQDSPNVMILGNGMKEIMGGQNDDHFVMNGNHTYGYLDGLSGEDVIDFSEYAKDHSIVMNFENSSVSLLSRNQKFNSLIVKNFEVFVGRSHSTDHVEVCNHTSIDLRGTSNTSDPDMIIISHSEQCQPITNLTVQLNNNTHIVCDVQNATVVYMVTRDTSNFVDIPEGSHHFIFNLVTLTEVRATMNGTLLRLSIGSSGQLDIKTSDATDLKFTFDAEKITMTLIQGKLIGHLNNIASIYETVENYATYLDENPLMHLIARTSHGIIKLSRDQSTIQKDGVLGNLNIISFDDKKNTQKLITRSDGENYFLMHNKLENGVSESMNGSLNVTIIATPVKQSVSYLDLKYFSVARDGNLDSDIKMLAVQDEDNIIITVVAVPVDNVDGLNKTEIGTVTIVDGMTYMDQIRIHLWSESQIKNFSNKLVIQPIPIHVNQHIYSIHPDQFEFNSSIYFNFKIRYLEAYSVNNSLIMTDVALLNNPKKNSVILTFIEFYVFKQKYETLILIFKNRRISLNASRELAKGAVDISLMWQRMNQRLDVNEEEEHEDKAFEEHMKRTDMIRMLHSLPSK